MQLPATILNAEIEKLDLAGGEDYLSILIDQTPNSTVAGLNALKILDAHNKRMQK